MLALALCLFGATTLRGEDAVPASHSCRGNEPFWSLNISGREAIWKTPESPAGQPLAGQIHSYDPAGVVSWRGELNGGELIAILVGEPCQDTMADQTFRFTAYLSMPDGDLRLGCCDLASDGPGTSEGTPERQPGDFTPIFTPASQTPPTGECYEHERVTGEDGRLVGWLSHDTC